MPDKAVREQLTITLKDRPDDECLASWDRLVASAGDSDVTQLSAWAEVRRLAGFESLYLHVWRGAELAGGALVLRKKVGPLGRVGYLPYGPVLVDEPGEPGEPGRDRRSVCERLAAGLAAIGRRDVALFVQPPGGGEDMALELLRRGFRFSRDGGARVAPAETIRVDLRVPEEQLRSRLSRRLRTWANQWPRKGVTVRTGDERDLPRLTLLAEATAKFQGFPPFAESYLRALYTNLNGHAVLLIGEVEGRAVAAELFTGCGGVLKSRIRGLDRADPRAESLNVGSAMTWEAMRWAKANGYHAYDFGGIRPESLAALRAPGPTDRAALAGPDQFKVKFGGDLLSYPPPVELIGSRTLRGGYDLLQRGDLLATIRESLRGGR